jgi:3-hydroxyacyl-CoA dehydrogenase/enoyl-CoA hydratase/3-hydroxybutyryl-CoA epimerase
VSEVAGLSHRIDGDGFVHVVFDRPGQTVNLLTLEIIQALDRKLEEWRTREIVRGVLFKSAKPGMFIAGMDVEEIAAATDAFRAAEAARFGQAVFRKIAELGKPSVCAIRGTCLGGGAELALACTTRLASDHPRVRIGLPEVQLGIIPGFGGTQRLPRLVGLLPSLDLILTGRRLDARRALRIGLVDGIVPDAYLEREALSRLAHAADGKQSPRKRRLSPMAMLINNVGPLRRFAISRAKKRTSERVRPTDYPAPFRALEAIEAAFALTGPQGFDLEARIVGELVPTSTSKNLIWIFKTQTALKREAGGIQASPRQVRRAAVIGAGIMGGGISQLVADRGIPVRLKDVRYEAVLEALKTAGGLWKRQLDRRRISRREAYSRMAFIAPTLEATGLKHVDLVIEAVVEDLEVKRAVLAEIEARTPDRAVFASNTSSLPISDIAAKAMRPERVVGLHFFNPVHRMPLVEVVAGRRSSPEALATVHDLATRLGKTPVIVRDSPGFLVNRILMLYLNEALLLLGEGVKIDDADRAMSTFGLPMGPFALLDQIGLDTANHVAGVLGAAFGKRLGDATTVLGDMVTAGRLGAKNGLGFYRYKNGRKLEPDPEAYKLAGATAPRELPAETLQERMILSMVNEAAACLEDGVVREPREIDIAMVMGTGFPPFRGGLLRYADGIGIPIVADRLSRLAEAQGGRFRPAGLLQEMVRGQRRFYR